MNHTNVHDYWHSSAYRFSRYCGEKAVDGHYACAIERPRRDRRTTVLAIWLAVIVVLTTSVIVSMAL